MKKLIPLIAMLTLFVGCAIFPTWKDAAGKSLATTAQTVDAAMKGWAMYVVTQNPPTNLQAKVRQAYGDYQVSFDAALKTYNVAVTLNNPDVLTPALANLEFSKQNFLGTVSTNTLNTLIK